MTSTHDRANAHSALRLMAVLTVGLVACDGASDTKTDSSGAEIFAPGVISTELPEFAVAFTPDGTQLFFNRTAEDRSSLALMVSNREGDEWSAADTVSFSGNHFDVDPFVTPDGSRLYFSSNRPTEPSDTLPDFNTWYVDLPVGQGSVPQLLPAPYNSESSEVFVSATRDGVLYFRSERDGTPRTYRAWETSDGPAVEVVPIDMNLADGVGNPLVAPDERFLLFVARHPNGVGGPDIYVSYRTADGWTPAEALGTAVNSTYAELAPALGPSGQYLYFGSERPGIVAGVADGVRPPSDIYRISLSDAGLR